MFQYFIPHKDDNEEKVETNTEEKNEEIEVPESNKTEEQKKSEENDGEESEKTVEEVRNEQDSLLEVSFKLAIKSKLQDNKVTYMNISFLLILF